MTPSNTTSTSDALYYRLSTADRAFATLQQIISGVLTVSADRSFPPIQECAAIRAALARSFIFETVRARRLVQHGAGKLPNLDSLERMRFLKATESLVPIRDVNEHGFEPSSDKIPRVAYNEAADAFLDELSMQTPPGKIVVGPVDLVPIAASVTALLSHISEPLYKAAGIK